MTEPATMIEPAPAPPERPADLPEKFWDQEAGAVRTEALLKSYIELERKLSALTQGGDGPLSEKGRARLLALLGRPDSPDSYAIEPPHELVAPEPELNARLFEAGFTQAQAQLVYELAAERLLPAVGEVVGELEAQRQIDRLERHFGGGDAWRGIAPQIDTWAQANLAPEVHQTLAQSCDGVLALFQMMRAGEPKLIGEDGGPTALSEESLREMVRDRRYWEKREPEFIARVTEGFRRLYAG